MSDASVRPTDRNVLKAITAILDFPDLAKKVVELSGDVVLRSQRPQTFFADWIAARNKEIARRYEDGEDSREQLSEEYNIGKSQLTNILKAQGVVLGKSFEYVPVEVAEVLFERMLRNPENRKRLILALFGEEVDLAEGILSKALSRAITRRGRRPALDVWITMACFGLDGQPPESCRSIGKRLNMTGSVINGRVKHVLLRTRGHTYRIRHEQTAQ